MAVKPNAGVCAIREQIIEDAVSGLTFQFISMPDSDAPVRLRIYGNLPHGNRETLFDKSGNEAGGGTAFFDSCYPTWLREIAD